MGLRSTDLLIDDETGDDDLLFKYAPDGEVRGRGQVERDFRQFPVEMMAKPSEMLLVPRSEWSDRIKEMEREKARLSDLRGLMPSLDQGRFGYCWAHSTVHTVLLNRKIMNVKYVPLSAYAVAAIIKNGRDEGAWCGLSQKFIAEKGVPSQEFWPQGSIDLRKATPQMYANAALHKITDDWVDLTRQVWDKFLTFDQVMSCLLNRIPCALDFNWWGHSVCGMDPVEVEPGSFGIRILNSWSDQWGDRGTSVLRGQKAIPNGAIATVASRASNRSVEVAPAHEKTAL